MKFNITEACVRCGACALDCPAETIRRGEKQYIIGPDCIGCGDCYAICPVGAVVMVKDLPTQENLQHEHKSTE